MADDGRMDYHHISTIGKVYSQIIIHSAQFGFITALNDQFTKEAFVCGTPVMLLGMMRSVSVYLFTRKFGFFGFAFEDYEC